MTDTTPLTDGLLDQLIDTGNKALNDYYHERACSCSEWPAKCASWKSPGDMFFGYWDTDAFAIALPAIIAAHEQQVTDARQLVAPDFTSEIRALLTEVDRLRAVEAAAYGFADEMGDYCSPHNVAHDYAQRLRERLNSASGAVQPPKEQQ